MSSVLHIDPIEALWFVVNAATLFFTLAALIDARKDYAAALSDNDTNAPARRLTARGNVRREVLRTLAQLLFISIVIPGLFMDRAINLSPALIALIAIPVVLFIATVLDARDRGRLADMLLTTVRTERAALALESSVQEVKGLVVDAAEKVAEALDVANHSNEKLARLTEIVSHKEDKPEAAA